MVYQKCNPSFQSQFAYLDKQQINISDYLDKRETLSDKQVYCNKGHILVAVNSENRKKHFRHKNTNDVYGRPMSEWHSEWQGNFPVTEVVFPRIFGDQVSERRADVVLNDTTIVELQHSNISPAEVFCRKNDYSLHGKNIIWIIDGKGVIIRELHNSRYFLDFADNTWKHKSFESYDVIYLDVNEQIYKVFPKFVKNGMTDVSSPKSKVEFIESLKNGINLWDDTIPPQCELFVKQQGAGNGKTYGIIQNIKSAEFSHYKTFIYVTKQHSAKYVMYNELNDQINKKEFIEYETQEIKKKDSKQYTFEFKHKQSGDIKYIIFGTIDSFMHAISNRNVDEYDTFLGIVHQAMEGNFKFESNSSIRFAGKNRTLTKETIFMIDECQDLAEDYARAIVRLMRATYIDCLVVGDLLQSIHYEKNAFRFFMSNENDSEIAPFINRKKLEATNICQRFKNPELISFVNNIVNFKKYNLPEVTTKQPVISEENCIHFFGSEKYNYDEESVKEFNDQESEDNEKTEEIFNNNLTKDCDKIMNLFEEEVLKNNRQPKNFLFVSPITKNNTLMQELELRIHLFWQNKYKDSDSNFKRYAIFHRSQEGTSINLEESNNATRLVSCHSAKGDGREVVFLIGFTEDALKKFTPTNDSLIFESMINVAMTRMKEKLYIQCVDEGDLLNRRYFNYSLEMKNANYDIKPVLPRIFKTKNIVSLLEDTEKWDFYQPIYKKANVTLMEDSSEKKKIIDMSHHSIRAETLDMMFMITLVKKERSFQDYRKKQHLCIFYDIANGMVKKYDYYDKFIKEIQRLKKSKEKTKIFPILNLKGRTINNKYYYFDIIEEYMKSMKKYVNELLSGGATRTPCPLELLVLYYMVDILRRGRVAEFNIFSLYDIIDKYNNGFQHDDSHVDCLCRKYFTQKCRIDDVQAGDEVYHVNHYNKLSKIVDNVNDIYSRYNNIAWLNNHPIDFAGGNDKFKLRQNIKYHGYDDEKQEILLCYIKPQYNSLNEKDILINIINDTWILQNHDKSKKENIQKYHGKKIKACVISLDSNIPKYIDIEDVVKKYDSIILQKIFTKWSLNLEENNNTIFKFYEYYFNKYKSIDKFTKQFSKKLKEHYSRDTNNLESTYIKDFFAQVIDNQLISEEIQETILNSFSVENTFVSKMNKYATKLLCDYLQVELEEEESDNNSESEDD